MTQWKNNLDLPTDEPMLIVRPCFVHLCWKIYPAAKLLSVLLYHARNELGDTFTIERSQDDITEIDMCGDMSEKTLLETAIPCLALLGYLEVDMSSYKYRYTLHMDKAREALTTYKEDKTRQQLEKLLIVYIAQQLEKTPIEGYELEEVLIAIRKSSNANKKNFQLLLEKVLIRIRESSNCKRGRKPRTQEASSAVFEETENLEIKETIRDSSLSSSTFVPDDVNDVTSHNNSYSHNAPETDDLQTGQDVVSSPESMATGSDLEDPDETVKMEAIRLPKTPESESAAHEHRPLHPVSPHSNGHLGSDSPGATTPSQSVPGAAQEDTLEQTTPAKPGVASIPSVVASSSSPDSGDQGDTYPLALSQDTTQPAENPPGNNGSLSGTQQVPLDLEVIPTSLTPGQRSGKSVTGSPASPDVAQAGQEELIQPSSKPEMPPMAAKWNKDTAILVSEAIRQKRYTDKQRGKNLKAAEKMFKEFPGLTRAQFTKIFTGAYQWWKEHGAGLATIGDIMAEAKNGSIRLQNSLDKLEMEEEQQNKPDSPPSSNGHKPPLNTQPTIPLEAVRAARLAREAQVALQA